METKFAKVLDSDCRVTVDLKRKRNETYLTGATRMMLPMQSAMNSSVDKLAKRRKLNGLKTKCASCISQSRKSLLKYYLNFKRSGLPHRLMCYKNGEWTDFSRDIVVSVRKDLQVKKAAIEVEFDGSSFVLDFLHMMQLDLKTGLQQPIAWIDEEGNCFFPETFSGYNELYECCHCESKKDQGLLDSERCGSQDIKLELEIDIKGLDFSKLMESSGESNPLVKKIQVLQKPASIHYDAEEDSCVRISDTDVDEAFGENQQMEENLVRIESIRRDLDSGTVREMFLNGISSSMNTEIVEIYRSSATSRQARLELFEKQIEITKKYRGDANVQYAWLPSSKGALSSMMMYGLGHCGIPKINSLCGIGVHLAPANCTNIRSVFFLY